ncbi:hypothetical protein BKA64DRAFT_755997 [Cadophora sp. MPI-SDFR-AT-0126]|nr:hypothetical protein BKA64DRAFT_755997 [Leotiomycetes sp. MPI-SDFR-AT-0126]
MSQDLEIIWGTGSPDFNKVPGQPTHSESSPHSPVLRRNRGDLNEVASLIFHKLCKNMEYYISIYGQSKGRCTLLDRLHSAGWYAVRLGDVYRLNLTAAEAAVFFQTYDYGDESEDWGNDFPSVTFSEGSSVPEYIDILMKRIAWTHDRVVELSVHMLQDPEPGQPLDKILKKPHGEDLESCEKIREKLDVLAAGFAGWYRPK